VFTLNDVRRVALRCGAEFGVNEPLRVNAEVSGRGQISRPIPLKPLN